MTARLAVWSGPRNLSTALMRSWENRSDTMVMDEPLYAHYLEQTGLQHPMVDEIKAAGPTGEAEAIATCLAPLPTGCNLSYQKHMSHHLLDGMTLEWLDQLTNVLLIRHPARVLSSYERKRDDVPPDSLTLDDIGFRQQRELFHRFDRTLPVIDSNDLLGQPAAYLEWLCELVELPFEDAMLAWPAGPRNSDGVWQSHWYDAVRRSTGFSAPDQSPLPKVDSALQPLLTEALAVYDELWSARLVI